MVRAIMLIAAVLILTATPALAELTDYQRGVYAGLQVGLYMGELHGMAMYTIDAADKFNNYIVNFNQFLLNTFGNNGTAIAEFNPRPVVPRNPTTRYGPIPDAEGRIGEYPAEAFYTATGSGGRMFTSSNYLPGV